MNVLELYRPVPQPLDPAWSAATLQSIFDAADRGRAPAPNRWRRRVLAVTTGAVAAAAVVVGVATTGTSAAFAVEQRGNGDLEVTIHRLTDPAGLERALRERGVDADVTYLRTAVPSDLDDGSSASPCTGGRAPGAMVQPEDGGFVVTFERAYLDAHDGAQLQITAAAGASADDWAGLRIEWSDGRC